jgi:hypothetical protein
MAYVKEHHIFVEFYFRLGRKTALEMKEMQLGCTLYDPGTKWQSSVANPNPSKSEESEASLVVHQEHGGIF